MGLIPDISWFDCVTCWVPSVPLSFWETQEVQKQLWAVSKGAVSGGACDDKGVWASVSFSLLLSR